MIIRIGILNKVDYVISAHVPAYALQEGLTLEQCDALRDWQKASSLFSESQRAALAYTDAMTRDVDVPDWTAQALRPYFSERQIVELSVLMAPTTCTPGAGGAAGSMPSLPDQLRHDGESPRDRRRGRPVYPYRRRLDPRHPKNVAEPSPTSSRMMSRTRGLVSVGARGPRLPSFPPRCVS
jgi:hypothetical protein